MRPICRSASVVFVSLGLSLLAGCLRDSPDTLMRKANEAIARNELRTASIHLKNLLQEQPRDGEARMLLARVHVRERDFRAAEREWLRALESGAAPDLALPGLLEARFRIGDAKGLLDAAQRHSASDPDARARVAYWSARARMQQGDLAGASAALDESLSLRPDDVPARAARSRLQSMRGDLEGARRGFDVLLEQSVLLEALVWRADVHLARRDLAAARADLEKAVATDADDPEARLRLVSLLLDTGALDEGEKQLSELQRIAPKAIPTLHFKALVDLRRNRLDAANSSLQEVLRIAPDHLPSVVLAAHVALAQGRLEIAERHARAVAERAPKSVEALRLIASVQLRRGDYAKVLETVRGAAVTDSPLLTIAGDAALRMNAANDAIGWFERALRAAPGNVGARSGLGMAKLATGRVDAGLADLEAAAAQDAGSTKFDVMLVSALLRAGRHDAALAAIDRIESKSKGTPLAHHLRGTALLARRDTEAARAAFEKALAIDPAYEPAIDSLATLDVRQGRVPDAKARYEALIARDPKNTRAMLAIAEITARSGGRTEDVAAQIQRALAVAPADPDAAIAMARLRIRAQQPKDAVALLQQALAQRPEDPRLLEVLASAYLLVDSKQQAIDTYERMTRTPARSAALLTKLGDVKSDAGDKTGALDAFRKAAELDPKSGVPSARIASTLLELGRRDEARQVATSLQKSAPSSAAGLLLEGDLLATEGQWAGASKAYRKAYEVDRAPRSLARLHTALLRADRTVEADAVLNDAIRTSPGDLALRMIAGESAVSRRLWPDAVRHYEAVVNARPNDVVALNNLAWSLHEARNPEAAKRAQEALRLAPDAAAVIDTAGVIASRDGDHARGVDLLRRATELAPRNPVFRLHYAEALIAAGDAAGARTQLETIATAHDGTPQAVAARRLVAKL